MEYILGRLQNPRPIGEREGEYRYHSIGARHSEILMKRFQHPNLDISRIIPGCGVWLWLEFQILGDQRPDYTE